MLRFQDGITLNNRFYSLNTEILNFLSHGLGTQYVKSLVTAIGRHNKIKILNLGENDFTDEVIPTICEHLLRPDSPLEQLDLGGNLITETGAQLLLEALSKNSRLIKFQLAGNDDIKNATLEQIQAILNKNKSRQSRAFKTNNLY